jgi:hypothetical protein
MSSIQNLLENAMEGHGLKKQFSPKKIKNMPEGEKKLLTEYLISQQVSIPACLVSIYYLNDTLKQAGYTGQKVIDGILFHTL